MANFHTWTFGRLDGQTPKGYQLNDGSKEAAVELFIDGDLVYQNLQAAKNCGLAESDTPWNPEEWTVKTSKFTAKWKDGGKKSVTATVKLYIPKKLKGVK